MTTDSESAQETLRELGTLTARSRAITRSSTVGVPILGWGIAWMVGYPALELIAAPWSWGLAAGAWALAMALSWRPQRSVRTRNDARLRAAWGVVLVSSPFFVMAAGPIPWTHAMLLLGALWSLAMGLSAIAMQDIPYAAVALLGVVVAGVAAAQETVPALTAFGLAAGGPLLALGAVRVLAERHRRAEAP